MTDVPPKRTEKIQLMLDDNELAAIDDWRFENRLPSRAAAIRELIRRGLVKAEDFDTPPSDASSKQFRVTEAPDEA
jgi:metal-responsive CopG/Arc/MetJ family transcriptional regulator